jgi:ubiquitin carboxyl-terminal hydrolase 10
MCFANAVLQLLVYCPPFWNQLGDLARLMGQRTDGGTTGLVDATVRFLDEFVYNNKPPLVQKSPQLDEKKSEEKNDIGGAVPFLPTYVYDAMREKRRLNVMLVRTCAPHSAVLLLNCAGLLRIGRPAAGRRRVF